MEWISVEDRLPEKNTGSPYVLCCYKNNLDNLPFIGSYGVWGEWWVSDGVKVYVTHWMPLPKPPK